MNVTTHRVKARLITITRIRNSINGNPRYECLLKIDDESLATHGFYLHGKTVSDSSFVYNMPRAGHTVWAEYHKTPKGNIKFSDMETA